MTSEPAVTVIISTHNRAAYLPDVLHSLAAQTCDVPYEFVVIDNASTDGTMAVLTEWCRIDPRFRVALEPRLGLSYGKNAGVRMARAPLLIFTDDDMVIDQRWIQSYVNLFAQHEGELMLAGGPCFPIPSDLRPWPDWFDERGMADVGLLQYDRERVLRQMEYVWGGNMAVPRSLFDRLGFWNEAVGRKGEHRGTFEDTEFQDRLRQAGGVVWFCPAAIVHHRIPRHIVTPRKIAATAFLRGRNAFWQREIPVWRDVTLMPKRNAPRVLLLLSVNLLKWAFWLVAFRLLGRREHFERARCAAYASGHVLESLRAGRGLTSLSTMVNRVTFRLRDILVRLSPETA